MAGFDAAEYAAKFFSENTTAFTLSPLDLVELVASEAYDQGVTDERARVERNILLDQQGGRA